MVGFTLDKLPSNLFHDINDDRALVASGSQNNETCREIWTTSDYCTWFLPL